MRCFRNVNQSPPIVPCNLKFTCKRKRRIGVGEQRIQWRCCFAFEPISVLAGLLIRHDEI